MRTLNAFGPIRKAHTLLIAMSHSSFSSSRLLARILSLGGGHPCVRRNSISFIIPQLVLLAMLHPGVFEERRGLLEYRFFREGVQEIAVVERDARAENL